MRSHPLDVELDGHKLAAVSDVVGMMALLLIAGIDTDLERDPGVAVAPGLQTPGSPAGLVPAARAAADGGLQELLRAYAPVARWPGWWPATCSGTAAAT